MTKIAAEAEAVAMATFAVVAVAADARVTNTILADALNYLLFVEVVATDV